MRSLFLVTSILAVSLGCGGPTFTNIGNGVGVPSDHIDKVADENNITRDEAKQRILDGINQRKSNSDN